MKSPEATGTRPLSPHLQIYRRTATMVMSIAHRLTGAALYVGTLLLAWWLSAVSTGPSAYLDFQHFIGSAPGKLILFGYTWALLHHLLSGLRHLIWDAGVGFRPSSAAFMARLTLIGSVLLTGVVWISAFFLTRTLQP